MEGHFVLGNYCMGHSLECGWLISCLLSFIVPSFFLLFFLPSFLPSILSFFSFLFVKINLNFCLLLSFFNVEMELRERAEGNMSLSGLLVGISRKCWENGNNIINGYCMKIANKLLNKKMGKWKEREKRDSWKILKCICFCIKIFEDEI